MTLKSTLAGTLIALVALALTAIGCGAGDACTTAADHLVDCLNPAGSPMTSPSGNDAKCTGTTACVADCINRSDCPAIQDAFGGVASAGSTAFLACTNGCKAP